MSFTLPLQVLIGWEVGTPNAIFQGYGGVPFVGMDSVRTPQIALMRTIPSGSLRNNLLVLGGFHVGYMID